ncbi:MAG: hypothetical protein LUD55_06240 [Oscillospiraceae bacterium]|nr:hypothetical protein [Oscillospiraceae bacterium]
MKKFTALLLSVVLCLSISLPASATYTEASSSEISIKDMFEQASSSCSTQSASESPVTCSAEITAEDGSTYSIALFEYTPAAVSDGESNTQTYVYSTQSEYVTPKASGNTQTNTGWDDSLSVYGYITITYNSRPYNDSGVTEYLLTKVSGGWERSDSTVSMSNRFVAYTSQYIFALSQVTWKYPTTNTFSYSTGYSTYVPNDNTTAVLGAQCSVDLAHGTSSNWTLTTQANLFTNDIGDLI